MNEEGKDKIPKVFISYSHDSPEHKAWVAELAFKLRENGVDVTLDRWDLRRGEDVPKFMERSVAWADRVLMICTDSYVRKADEGKGGVGYEAMIVTGELVKDLGTSKFIPVIRQIDGKSALPKFMSTRFYVNLSDDQKFAAEFEELLRELHNEPALKKPAIGKNPFAQTPSGNEIRVDSPLKLEVPAEGGEVEGIYTYQAAMEVARAGDLVIWRRRIHEVKAPISARLLEWRKTWERKSLENKDLIPLCLEGIAIYEKLIAMAIVGVESGREVLRNQAAVLDDMLTPKNWDGSGRTLIVSFPETAAFTYQALHGAVCLETQQLDLALELAKGRVQRRHEEQSAPLFHQKALIGAPGSFLGQPNIAWKYLRELPKTWPWLIEIMGDQEGFEVAVAAYYLSLNVLELADTIARGKEEDLAREKFWFDVPLSPLFMPNEQRRRAYRLMMRDPKQVRKIWQDLGVPESSMRAQWPKWIAHCAGWLSGISQGDYWGGVPHESLFEDLPMA